MYMKICSLLGSLHPIKRLKQTQQISKNPRQVGYLQAQGTKIQLAVGAGLKTGHIEFRTLQLNHSAT